MPMPATEEELRAFVLAQVEQRRGAYALRNSFTNPNGNVIADLGVIYLSATDGSQWNKESGAGTDSGWVKQTSP